MLGDPNPPPKRERGGHTGTGSGRTVVLVEPEDLLLAEHAGPGNHAKL
jgi:hypothetical protein